MKTLKFLYLFCALALCLIFGCGDDVPVLDVVDDVISENEPIEISRIVWSRTPSKDITLQVPDEFNTLINKTHGAQPYRVRYPFDDVIADAIEYNDIIFMSNRAGTTLHAFDMKGEYIESENMSRDIIREVRGELNYREDMVNEDQHSAFIIDNLLFRETVIAPGQFYSIIQRVGYAVWDLDSKIFIRFIANVNSFDIPTGWTQKVSFPMNGLLYKMIEYEDKHLNLSAFEFANLSFQPAPEQDIILQLPQEYHDLYMNAERQFYVFMPPHNFTYNFVADGRIYLPIHNAGEMCSGHHVTCFHAWNVLGGYLGEVNIEGYNGATNKLDPQFYHERTKILYAFGDLEKNWADDNNYRIVWTLIAFHLN